MQIPEVRAELRELAAQHGIPRLNELADELYRRPPVKRARPKARRVTEELRIAIRAYALANPGKSNREVGRHFGVDGGRVSEAINGFRD